MARQRNEVRGPSGDGLVGGENYKTGRWLGFQGKDMDAVIDLKEPTEFSKVSFNTNVVKGDWIMETAGITVKVSDDTANCCRTDINTDGVTSVFLHNRYYSVSFIKLQS